MGLSLSSLNSGVAGPVPQTEAQPPSVAEKTGNEYPYVDGENVVIGPDCVGRADGSLITWKGTNYVPQTGTSGTPEEKMGT